MVDAVYIHIPFCHKKCDYCDFLVLQGSEDKIGFYIENIIEEIKLYPKYPMSSIYFGGGTPSLLSPEDIKRVLNEFTISENCEITLEVNPNSVDFNKLAQFKEIGVNRISIGIQSFNDEVLKILGREHTRESAKRCFFDARKAGFDEISLDLMYSVPGENMEILEDDLREIIHLRPEHISIYSLIWEEGTVFWSKLIKGNLKETSDDLEAEMFERIIESLSEAGYTHYEISNFGRDGYRGRHNLKYWHNKEYYGIGVGASGYFEGVRYKNVTNLYKHGEYVGTGRKPIGEREKVGERDKVQYGYILGLRILDEWCEVKNEDREKFEKLFEKRLLEKNSRGEYRLSKRGLFIANDVFAEILD